VFSAKGSRSKQSSSFLEVQAQQLSAAKHCCAGLLIGHKASMLALVLLQQQQQPKQAHTVRVCKHTVSMLAFDVGLQGPRCIWQALLLPQLLLQAAAPTGCRCCCFGCRH
jgi:hypothetical protein